MIKMLKNPQSDEGADMIARYVTNTYEITDTYNKIFIDAKDAKVKIEPSNEGNTKIEFYEKKRYPYTFSVQDNILTVKPKKARWYDFLRVGIVHSKISISVPGSMLEAVSVISNVGSVDVRSIDCNGTVDIQANTGKVDIYDVSCKTFDSKGNTGSITLNGITAEDSIYIKRNTGEVSLIDCNVKKIFVKTNTGRVCGRLPSGTVYAVKTNTGKIEIPKATIGEEVFSICEVKTNTGRVKFE